MQTHKRLIVLLGVIRQHRAVLKLMGEMVSHDSNEFFIFLVLVLKFRESAAAVFKNKS